MRFLADMGVSNRVVEWLVANGHEATHLRDEGLQRLPNGLIFQKALVEQRVVLTFDLDFGDILAGCNQDWASVVLFRLADATTENVIARLNIVLLNFADDLAQGAIIVVEQSRCRVRRLPFDRSESPKD